MREIIIRRARPEENTTIHAMVQVIADETFAFLFGPRQVPIGEADWFSAWVAISGDEIVGVAMTRDEWVSDLWVRSDSRRSGIGAKLLAHAEGEIRQSGARDISTSGRQIEYSGGAVLRKPRLESSSRISS